MSTSPNVPEISSDLEDRLQRLNAKRQSTRAQSEPKAAEIDEALAARLADLSSNRSSSAHSPASSERATEQQSKRPKPKRKHPARRSRIAALALSLVTSGGLTAGFGLTGSSGSAIVAQANPPLADTTSTTSSSGTVALTTAPIAIAGDVFRNRWGDVQVEATFNSAGDLTDVTVLRVPYDNGQSIQINNYAVPILNSEALTTQTARVDTVSGATYTSNGYQQSLQSAIDTALSEGLTVNT